MASNAQLRIAFKQFYDQVVQAINPTRVIDVLYSRAVLSDADNEQLLDIPQQQEKVRQLLTMLFRGRNPEAFIVLREAIGKDPAYQHLIGDIDKCARNAPKETVEDGKTLPLALV